MAIKIVIGKRDESQEFLNDLPKKTIPKISKDQCEAFAQTAKADEMFAAIRSQLEALGQPKFRVTCMQSVEKWCELDLSPLNYGNAKWLNRESEFFWHVDDTLKNNLADLIAKNDAGYNIYFTPIENKDHVYILVDDLTDESLPEFLAAGYKPALLLYSSEKMMQAVLIVNGLNIDDDDDDDVERERQRLAIVEFFNQINRKFGDKRIRGLRHPLRLAGFKNMKKTRNKYVSNVIRAEYVVCEKSNAEIAEIAASQAIERLEAGKRKRKEMTAKIISKKELVQSKHEVFENSKHVVDVNDVDTERVFSISDATLGRWRFLEAGRRKLEFTKDFTRNRTARDMHMTEDLLFKFSVPLSECVAVLATRSEKAQQLRAEERFAYALGVVAAVVEKNQDKAYVNDCDAISEEERTKEGEPVPPEADALRNASNADDLVFGLGA